jgi:beta-galactosidase
MSNPSGITRRDLLKSAALAGVAALARQPVAQTLFNQGTAGTSVRLTEGWEYYGGGLAGAMEVWRSDKADIDWRPVQLPHCFNARDAVDPDDTYYKGPGWYRSKLKILNPFPGGRSLLHFEGAGQKSEVFINLDKVGHHIGGYDEFVVDISDAAAKVLNTPHANGEVPVAVLCDNSRDLDLIPSSLSDFVRYGGLYRPVNLVYVPAISPERIHIDAVAQPGKPAKVSVKAKLFNPGSLIDTTNVQVRIFDPGGSIVYNNSRDLPAWSGETELASFEVSIPQLWSPARPVLYRCDVKLSSRHGTMSISERFGFRYFEFLIHGPFKLNGERLLLRGTQRHEDGASVGAAMPDEAVRKEMKLIKDMGANFIRLAHYQQSRTVLGLCDELGLLVWEEIPWGRGGVGGERSRQQVKDMLHAMINQHYNHPSVIIWGLGNEIDQAGDFPMSDKDKIREFVKELNGQAHALDPLRKTALRRCDFCKDIVDIYSPSIWAGWYQGRYTDYKDRSKKELEEVDHFLHIEWGGESHARRHAEQTDRFIAKVLAGETADSRELDYLLTGGQDHAATAGDWSETYVCNLFDWHLKEQETMPWLTGTAQWIFKDFASPLRAGNPIPRVNQKGLVERDCTPKEAYYVFQSYWAETPMIHIYGHTWPVRWGDLDEQKLVKVYSNCQTVELFVNDKSCGSKKRASEDFPAAGLHWLVNFKAGENDLRAVGRKNGETVTDEIHFQYHTGKWGKPAGFELKKNAEQGQTAMVEAKLVDANGVLCLDARTLIRFGITGDGTLLDNAGTSTGSRCLELYNGRAEITLRLNNGKSVVTVSSKGLPTAFLPLG